MITFKNRAKFIILFFVVGLAHHLCTIWLDTVFYFLVTALFDFFLIVLLTKFNDCDALRLDISILSLISIFANLLGAIMFLYHFAPILYNSITNTIVLIQIIRLIMMWHGRDSNNNTIDTLFRPAFSRWI